MQNGAAALSFESVERRSEARVSDSDFSWYRGRLVLITGGMGFIGSHVAEALVELGARVTVVDSLIPAYGGNPFNIASFRDRLDVSITDIRDRHGMAYLVKDQEVVFNLAGQVSHIDSMNDPEPDLEINCKAQLGLMEALRYTNHEARVVFASTRQVYGRPQYLPVDERHPVNPTDVNGINKHAGEQYHLLYASVYGLPTVVLRLTNTYGPRQLMHHGRQGFIPVFIRQAMEGETITLFGGGSQRRDANFVTDVVDAFLLAGLNAPEISGRVFNLGGKPSFSLLEFAQLLVSIVGKGAVEPADWPPEKAKIDIGDFEGDFSRITAELGWKPQVGLAEGIERTVDFLRRDGEHYW
jgi:nucleoside-diphosphate-sugar epimerase